MYITISIHVITLIIFIQSYDTSDNKLRREFESYGSIKSVSNLIYNYCYDYYMFYVVFLLIIYNYYGIFFYNNNLL